MHCSIAKKNIIKAMYYINEQKNDATSMLKSNNAL